MGRPFSEECACVCECVCVCEGVESVSRESEGRGRGRLSGAHDACMMWESGSLKRRVFACCSSPHHSLSFFVSAAKQVRALGAPRPALSKPPIYYPGSDKARCASEGRGGCCVGSRSAKGGGSPPGLFGAAGRRARPLDTSRTAPPAPPAPPVLSAVKCDTRHFPAGFRKEASENG